MTIQEQARFAHAFNRLAVAVRLPADQSDAAMKQIFFDGLADLPIEAIEDAARELASAAWFPKLGEWRSVAEKARNARDIAKALPDPGRGWSAECESCDDTGWEPRMCDGSSLCGRTREHVAHSYTTPCLCRATNRTYQRRLAEARERARGRKGANARD